MITNNHYLPHFFLCWAFLYSPVAELSVWHTGGSGQEQVAVEKPLADQILQHSDGEKPVPDDFTCFWTVYGNVVWDFIGNLSFIVPFYLTVEEELAMEVSSCYPFNRLYALKPKNPV
ncbi:hypothetical protein [Pedobacter endophyticus]|uniref:Uncharacterized protein n=1 Tax=Pedobacter endophyticus TaxID=2789740 RepID=A0A7S9L155_9SPHI|nr:hypothetical protein [Pedobacter endophyticus]QPH40557.1 hypothetical protein IZT61_04555 [Pedobacter endophyticus]